MDEGTKRDRNSNREMSKLSGLLYFLNQDIGVQQLENQMRPLWQLAKSTLTQTQNLLQFHHFLKTSARKHHHQSSISFNVMFLRVAVLIMFFQAECFIDHWWVLAYFVFKAGLLFNVGFEIRQSIQILCMLACFHLLDYITNLLPFINTFYWIVNIAYFLFGIEEKYLSLNLMMLPIPVISKSVVVTLLGLGKVKKAPQNTRIIAYMDVVVLLVTRRVQNAVSFVLLLGLVETVRQMDHRMIYTKKNYTHLDEIPSIQQYH